MRESGKPDQRRVQQIRCLIALTKICVKGVANFDKHNYMQAPTPLNTPLDLNLSPLSLNL